MNILDTDISLEKVLIALNLCDKMLSSLQHNHLFLCSNTWKILYTNNNFIGYLKPELVNLNLYNDLLDHNMIQSATDILILDKLCFLHKSKHTISYKFQIQSLNNNEMYVLIIDTSELDVTYKTMFVSNISNQLKMPLTGVLNTLKQLEYTNLTNEQSELISTIKENSSELLIIINDVLDITKLESDEIDLNLGPFSVNKFIDDNLNLLNNDLVNDQITMNYNISSNTPKYIVSDYHRLSQILINILKNSIKYTNANHKNHIVITVDAEHVGPYDPAKLPSSKNKKSLLNLLKSSDSISNEYAPISRNSSVELTNSDEYVEHMFEIDSSSRLGDIYLLKWSIRDNGMGIPKNKLHKLFNNTFNSEDFNKHGSYGLGLTICKQLCDLFKGKIWVADSVSSRGTTICFNIYTQIFNYIGKMEYNEKLIKKKVLFVEEDQNSRMAICNSLLNLEMVPIACASFMEAVMYINKTHFDVIIINIPNPDITGVQLAQKIKKLNPNIPIIAIYDVENMMDKKHDIYFKYVMKPIKMDNLISVLVSAIESAHSKTPYHNIGYNTDSESETSHNHQNDSTSNDSDENLRKLSLVPYHQPNPNNHQPNPNNHQPNNHLHNHLQHNLYPNIKSAHPNTNSIHSNTMGSDRHTGAGTMHINNTQSRIDNNLSRSFNYGFIENNIRKGSLGEEVAKKLSVCDETLYRRPPHGASAFNERAGPHQSVAHVDDETLKKISDSSSKRLATIKSPKSNRHI